MYCLLGVSIDINALLEEAPEMGSFLFMDITILNVTKSTQKVTPSERLEPRGFPANAERTLSER